MKKKEHNKSRSRKNNNEVVSTERLYTFYVLIPFVNVTHTLRKLSKRATVRELKEVIEITCGIPTSLQRIYFLDQSDLTDDCVLTSLDIVNKATFTLAVWNKWENIIRSVYKNDFKGVTDYVLCSDRGHKVSPVATRQRRGEVALLTAVKLGNVDVIRRLLEEGINVNARTELGYTPLHIAVANGKYRCIDFLLEKGAIDDSKTNPNGQEAVRLSKENGYPDSERHLCMFEWQLRAKTAPSRPTKLVPLLQHQQFDSKNPTWFDGPLATKFVCSTLPQKEFSGTRINAPPVVPVVPPYQDDKEYFEKTDSGAERMHTYISHENWLRRKQEEAEMLRQKQEQLAAMRLIEKEREETEKKRLMVLRKREHEKRTLAIKDSANEKYRKKQGIYEDYTYVPGYSKSILQQYMSDMMT
ncbi:uncharacterized protein [Clytia hemisphaerica]|uniref:uncharacterized protein n=1 Tax=Clytia hemisphaerica TaxID=252671 RepID=UPI0034D52D80|eukprot:TCONS_00021836-protein